MIYRRIQIDLDDNTGFEFTKETARLLLNDCLGYDDWLDISFTTRFNGDCFIFKVIGIDTSKGTMYQAELFGSYSVFIDPSNYYVVFYAFDVSYYRNVLTEAKSLYVYMENYYD